MSPADRWRFGAFYLAYYAALGAYTPYFSRWLDARGLSAGAIGVLFGLWYASRIVSPPAWSALVGGSPWPGRWLVAGVLGSAVCFAGFAWPDAGFAWLFAVSLGFGLCCNAVMPQFEAMTLNALGARRDEYGQVRLWGSVGFLVVAASGGWLMDRFGDDAFLWLTLPLLGLAVAAAWPHRRDRPLPHDDHSRLGTWQALRQPGVRSFLGIVMLAQVGFGPFYVFYTLALQRAGHDGLAVGGLWALGIVAEIAMFWWASWLLARVGAARLMGWCLGVNALRWIVVALAVGSLPLMAAAQLAHALGFAVFHACVMRLLAEYFPGRALARGQGLMYALGSGVGGVLGALLAAAAWDAGGTSLAFGLGALATAGALALHLARPRRGVGHVAA